MNGVQTRFKCKLDVKRCKRFVFPPSSLLPRSNALKTKAIRYFQTDRTLTRIVSPPLIDSFLKETYRFPDLEALLNDYDIILSPKRHYPYNVATQYAIFHLVNDLNLLKEVIQHLTPEYAEAFHTFMYHCNAYSGYNMSITGRKHFDEYSQWLFSVLFELEKRVKLSAYPDQARLFGYLSERLINVYCIRHRLKIKYVPVIMPLEETFQNPNNLLYTLRRLKNDLIYKLTEL